MSVMSILQPRAQRNQEKSLLSLPQVRLNRFYSNSRSCTFCQLILIRLLGGSAVQLLSSFNYKIKAAHQFRELKSDTNALSFFSNSRKSLIPYQGHPLYCSCRQEFRLPETSFITGVLPRESFASPLLPSDEMPSPLMLNPFHVCVHNDIWTYRGSMERARNRETVTQIPKQDNKP